MNQTEARRAVKAALNAQRGDVLENLRSELNEAGIHSLGYFQTMIDPSEIPPERVPDNHAAMSAVFKTPFIVDLPFSGVWNAQQGATAALGPDNSDGYSEVIAAPGTTDCIFHTLGVEANPWTIADSLDPTIFEATLVPCLETHPIQADIVLGRTQIVHGLKTFNVPGSNEVAVLPKLNSAGNSVFEMSLLPEGVAVGDPLEILVAFFNPATEIVVHTTAFMTLIWDSGTTITLSLDVASTGDNNTQHSGYFLFQTTLPANNDFVRSFYFEVADNDPSSHWICALKTHGASGVALSSFGVRIEARSACAFVLIDAPELGALSATDAERTTALSVLCTYMGSDLENGGQIAAARLSMAYSPLRAPNGDVYSNLASIPFYNDNFPLKDGIYVWWLPDSVQEYFYTPYRKARSDDLEQNSVLQVAMMRDNSNQAVRLEIVQNLEVLTRSRLYASKSGPINPAFHTVIGAVKVVPAVTINRRHKGILGKAFGAAKGWISKPTNWKKLMKVGSSILPRMFS